MGPYIPYGLFQTKGKPCAKFGFDRLRSVDLYKVQTNIQTFIFIYKMYMYTCVYVCMYVCMRVNVCIRVFIRKHIVRLCYFII
jgi:hypothetical protein